MSLLDDARRMLAIGPNADNSGDEYPDICQFCHVTLEASRSGRPPEDHRSDCPWLSMPKIVAALEAAQALAFPVLFLDHDPEDERPDAHQLVCGTCGEATACDCTDQECDELESWRIAMDRNYYRIEHDGGCEAQAFLAVYSGDST